MDVYSLVAANIVTEVRPGPMDGRAENRYYAQHVAFPRPGTGLLGSIALAAGVLVMLLGIHPF